MLTLPTTSEEMQAAAAAYSLPVHDLTDGHLLGYRQWKAQQPTIVPVPVHHADATTPPVHHLEAGTTSYQQTAVEQLANRLSAQVVHPYTVPAAVPTDAKPEANGKYKMPSIEQVQGLLNQIVKDHIHGIRTRSLQDSIKYTVKGQLGEAEVYVYAGPAGTPETQVQYKPPMIASHMTNEVTPIKAFIQQQAELLCEMIATGVRPPALAIRERRGPGRPPSGFSPSHGNPLGTPTVNPEQYALTMPTPGHQQGYDLVFRAVFDQPNDSPIPDDPAAVLGNPLRSITYYVVQAVSQKGVARLDYERKLNYPTTFRPEELRPALYFYEGRNLRSLVVDDQSNALETGAQVVQAMDAAAVQPVPFNAIDPSQFAATSLDGNNLEDDENDDEEANLANTATA